MSITSLGSVVATKDSVIRHGTLSLFHATLYFTIFMVARVLKNNFSDYDEKFISHYYAAYYVPNNLYKIQLLFLELFRDNLLPLDGSNLRVLDIGSSVGTSAWALVDLYDILRHTLQLYEEKSSSLPHIDIHSIERSTANINIFNRIHAELGVKKDITVHDPLKMDVTNLTIKEVRRIKPDVIIVSNVLNEIDDKKKRENLIDILIESLGEKGIIILVEPASEGPAIRLNELRGHLARKLGVIVLGPCGKIGPSFNACQNCWTFRCESLNPPKTMKLFSKLNGANTNEELKWSYAIVKKGVENPPFTLPPGAFHF